MLSRKTFRPPLRTARPFCPLERRSRFGRRAPPRSISTAFLAALRMTGRPTTACSARMVRVTGPGSRPARRTATGIDSGWSGAGSQRPQARSVCAGTRRPRVSPTASASCGRRCLSLARRGFRTPDFSDMVDLPVAYRHVCDRNAGVASNFLDVACKVPYLVALGINVLQPLPVDEQETNPEWAMAGPTCSRRTSPMSRSRTCRAIWRRSMRCTRPRGTAAVALARHRVRARRNSRCWSTCATSTGIAVVFDVVYNHAGGFSVRTAGSTTTACTTSIAQPIAATTTTAFTSPIRIAAPAGWRSRCGTTRSPHFCCDNARHLHQRVPCRRLPL